MIWTTKTRATKHQLARHGRMLERKLLCDEATERSTHDVRALDADRVQQMRHVVSEQTDRLRAFRLVGSCDATRIEADDAEVARQFGNLLEPDPTTGRKPRYQHHRRAITLQLVIELYSVYR